MASRKQPPRGKWARVRRCAPTSLAVEPLELRRLLTSTGYLPLNLVSDQSATALLQDGNLVNPWGMTLNPQGGDLWVAENGTGVASRYNGAVGGMPGQPTSPFGPDTPAVTIPDGQATGAVYNGSASFVVSGGGAFGPASFLFASVGGGISGYNSAVPSAPSSQAEFGLQAPPPPNNAPVYTGLALANNTLYAADFRDNRIDMVVFDALHNTFVVTGSFSTSVPTGYAPYNIVTFGNQLYVTYALQGANNDAAAGQGDGFVDVFDLNGNFVKTLISYQPGTGPLNAPWGLVQAQSGLFGDFTGDLLVANHGDGTIHAFDPQTGALVGTLALPSGQALTIPGLRGLAFGNGVLSGSTNELFFSAGPNGGADGLLGVIQSAQGVSMVAQGSVISTTANQSFNGTLAVFNDAQSFSPGNFSATISWGDGTPPSAAGISALASGGFAISGTHAYTTSGLNSISIQIHDPMGHSASASALAHVTTPGLSMNALTFTPTEGSTFSGAVATFTDGDGNTSPAAYQATIVWGDGAPAAAGTVSFAAGKFTVTGAHAYAEEGTQAVTVTVSDADAPTATVTSTAKIGDAPLSGSSVAVAATLDALLNGQVATFVDGNPNPDLNDFTATVDWGDGTLTSGLVSNVLGTTFAVAGSHTYAAAGNDTITVTIKDAGGSKAVVSETAVVTDIDVLGVTLVGISPTQGTLYSGALATVSDTNLATTFNQLAATINWGDGTVSNGTITGAAGLFAVAGAHLYAGEGRMPLSITVTHIGGTASASAVSTITVADTGALSFTGVAVTATEGAAFSGKVATVGDTYAAPAAYFTASIDWGDNTISTGTVSGPDGQFTISGDHTYTEAGAYLPVVTVADLAPGTLSASGTITAVAKDASLTASAATLNETEGQAFSDTVANFTDANPFAVAGDFTATIDWGDGTPDALGTISGTTIFQVAGTHTYAIGGTYTATVTIDDAGGSSAVASSKMVVADYPLTATGVAVTGSEGQVFSGTVATFADTNPDGGNLLDYSATIVWGDGGSSDGTISGSLGNYTVNGTHLFTDVSDLVTIVINDAGGASVTATASASIADANTFTPFGSALSTTEGTTLSAQLATFSDTYSGNPASDFSASVDWGDGLTTPATVTGQNGQFSVSGSHAYAEAGDYTASVAIWHNSPGTAADTADTSIDVAEASLSGKSQTIDTTEGNAFTGVVASFGDANTLSAAADFTATITWGDATTSTAGTLTMLAAGSFVVSGTHTYADEATGLPVTVVVNDAAGSQVVVASTADVADAPLTPSSITFSATEGAAYSGQVATFTDGNSNATAADFTAEVDWGDGTAPSAGAVTAAPGGVFVVTGLHTYAEETSTHSVTVNIVDRGGSATSVTSQAKVADAPLTAAKVTFAPTEGIAFSGVVATFTDADPAGVLSDYSAAIDWGDGSASTSGTVSMGAGGGFEVTGAHTYAEKSNKTVTVTISDLGGTTATALSAAKVADAPLTPGVPLALNATEGVSFTGTLGTFTDGNPNATKSEFTATIDWGDGGATSLGTILTAPGGVFLVSGTHVYATATAGDGLSITVADVDGSQATVVAAVHVASTHFTAAGAALTTTEGLAYSGAVATCNDSSTNPADYSATIRWGDGAVTSGTIAVAPGGGFFIDGNHVFANAGMTSMTVVVTNASADVLSVASRANVVDAPLSATGTTITTTEGSAFSGPVATFTDADPGGKASDYAATIHWGDGASSPGTITSAPGGGFAVLGAHTYTSPAQGLSVTVNVSDVGGATAAASSTANVADAPLVFDPDAVTVPPGGAATNLLLATVNDLGGVQPPANYSATIDWGDHAAPSPGMITAAGTAFQITGSHQYLLPGKYSLNVMVSDAGGASATTPVTVTVLATANQLFVQAAYLDVLARPVDNSGLLNWSRKLDAGQSRAVVANSIDQSAEYYANLIISPAYERYLGRPADPSGLAYWVDQMQNHGLTDEHLEAGFIGSPEFYAHAGGTDKAWVDAMYQDLLGRPPDPSGEGYWLQQLANGTSRAAVAYGFAASQERESQRITDDYMHYLGRQPDSQGVSYWLAQFANGVTNEDLITGFVASDEYFSKHTSQGGT
ncbi:MAG TPA: TIGR03118 family protein [Pirellulales bacterium]|nr:TIGR03118 family protein [Pirellulales bacterium]